ncbi:MAG: DUF3795 domain-containing protein [Dehalococcoidales bacterium]|nr:DUF3795 domain-containing protein [Dehalococcoidales bacterium]
MSIKITPELIAPCGMDCGVCKVYLTTVKSGVKGKGCTGCRPRRKKCAYLKGQCELIRNDRIKFCFECPTFPCAHLKGIDKRYIIGYNTSFIGNLLAIKEKGLAAFLKDEEQKWRCPDCGGTVSIHDCTCYEWGAIQKKR